MNNSVFDNETQQYAARVIASSDDEQMTAMMKEAEALEKELGFVPQKEAQAQEVAQKEQETEAPKFYDFVNKAGEDLKKEVDSTVEQTEDDSFGQAMKDVGRGMVGGALDFAEGLGNTFIDGVNALEAWGKSKGIDINVMPDDAELTFADEILTPKNPQEAIIRKIGQYLIPFAGAARMIKTGSALVKWTKTTLASALISAATNDPDDERLADMIKDVPWVPDLAVQMTEFLQSKPGDTRAEARFKNFTESLIWDSTLAGAFFGICKGAKIAKDLYKQYKIGAKAGAKEAAEEVAKAGAKEVAEAGAKEAAEAGAKEAAEAGAKEVAEAGAKEVAEAGAKEVAEAGAKEAAEAGAKEAAEAAAKAKPILGPDGQPLPSPVTKMREMIGPKPTDEVVAKIRDAQTADAMLTALRENPGYDNIETLVQSARRGVQDDATVRANAEAILANRKRTEELIQREAGRALNAEETTALRMLWEREFLSLQNLRIKDVKNATPEQLALFQEQLNRFIAVGAQVKGASAELGRGLRTLQQAVEAAPDDAARMALMNKYMDLNGGPESIKDVAEILNTVLDMNPEDLIENAVKIQRRSLFMRITDALAQAWMEGIFWATKTQSANLFGNVFSTLDNLAVTAIQRGAAMTGLAEEVVVKGEVAASLKGMWQGMIEGFGAMKTYLKEGKLEDAVSRFGRIEQNITPQVFGVPETSWLGKTIQGFGYASSMGLRATTAMDVFFRHINFRMRVNQLLTREAVQMGLEGKAVQDYVKARLGDVPDHIIKNARKYAEASIFAKPFDEVAYGGLMQSMADQADKIPMGRAIFPFMRFAANLPDYIMQRTPGMSYISPEFRMAMKAGGARRQEALAKLGLGTSLIGLGAFMAATGTLTGSGPRDYATRKALNAGDKGWQPCSIRFDDGSSWAINRLAPHGLLLCMGADIAEMIGALFDENKEAQYDLIGAAVGIFATYFTPLVIDDYGDFFGVMKSVRQGEPLTTTTTKTLGRFFTGMVPFSGGLKEVSRLQDKTRYDTTPGPIDEKSHMESLWKVWEAVKNEWLANNGIPGFSHGLPPQLNIFGEVVHYPPGVGIDLISPIFSNAPEDNKARAEMERLGMVGPFARQRPAPGGDILKVSMPDRFLTEKIGKKTYHINLTPHQYHRYVQLSAGIGLGEGVPTLKEAIIYQIDNGWPMNEELFGFARDEKGDIKDAAKILIIKQIISDYRRDARKKMYEEFPELADKFHEYRGQRAQALGVDFIEGEE